MTWGPVYLAQSLGYFQQERVAVAVSDAGGLSKGMGALLGGSVDNCQRSCIGYATRRLGA